MKDDIDEIKRQQACLRFQIKIQESIEVLHEAGFRPMEVLGMLDLHSYEFRKKLSEFVSGDMTVNEAKDQLGM